MMNRKTFFCTGNVMNISKLINYVLENKVGKSAFTHPLALKI